MPAESQKAFELKKMNEALWEEIYRVNSIVELDSILSRHLFSHQDNTEIFPSLEASETEQAYQPIVYKKGIERGVSDGEQTDSKALIRRSPYLGMPQSTVSKEIVSAFNQNRQSIMTSRFQWISKLFSWFGYVFKRIKPNEFRLVVRNNVPELVAPCEDKQRISMTFNPQNESRDLGTFPQTDAKFGGYGHYVLNVPLGQYAKVSFNNENYLYGPGQHVIHNQNFTTPTEYKVDQNAQYIHHKDIHLFNVAPGQYAKIQVGVNTFHLLPPGKHQIRHPNLVFNQETGFVDRASKYIQNGNQHLFNIPQGYFAKIRIGNEYKILDAGTHYIESGNLFFKEQTDIVKQTELHINHGNIHILNIPKGKMALVYEDNIPKILESGHHVINNGNFVFNEAQSLLSQSESYIKHQNIHRVLVQPGHIALVSVDGKTSILRGREEPYFFKSNNFAIAKQHEAYTFDQNTKQISFNGLHYILPDQGEVAVLYDGGELTILPNEEKPRPPEGEAFVLESGTARFQTFLDKTMQTIEFPSKKRQEENLKRGEDEESARFDKFITAEGTNVAVRFVIAYQIQDPKKALEILKSKEKIEEHIEGLVNADMGKAISNTSFWNLLNSNRAKASSEGEETFKPKASVHEDEHWWQDIVKAELHKHLEDCGIHLVRLNIEETTVLDESIREQMKEQSLTATNAKSQRAILQTQNKLAQEKAMQDREMQRLEQETANQTAQLKAQLELKQYDLQKELAVKKTEQEQAVKKVEQAGGLERQVMQAEAEKKVRVQEAEGKLIAKEKEAEGQMKLFEAEMMPKRIMAELMQSNPAYQQAEMVKALSEALKESQYLAAAGIYNNMPPQLVMAKLLGGVTETSSQLAKGTLATGLGNMMAKDGFFAQPDGTKVLEGQQQQKLEATIQ